MKTETEFVAVDDHDWVVVDAAGVEERVLARDPDDPVILTRLVRWPPGYETGGDVIVHEYAEEVLLLEGGHDDLGLGVAFTAPSYASRRPGMRHGPYRSRGGCVMLETRTRSTRPSAPTDSGGE